VLARWQDEAREEPESMTEWETFGLSGAECAEALQQLGLDRVRVQDGATVLSRGDQLVVVPDAVLLPAPVLHAILARANVSLDDVLRALDDIPTEPEIRSGTVV
jgi:hypothetical protein